MITRRGSETLIDALTGVAGRVVAAHKHRRTQRMIERFSNRRLEDIGFRRDWDGSIDRLVDRL